MQGTMEVQPVKQVTVSKNKLCNKSTQEMAHCPQADVCYLSDLQHRLTGLTDQIPCFTKNLNRILSRYYSGAGNPNRSHTKLMTKPKRYHLGSRGEEPQSYVSIRVKISRHRIQANTVIQFNFWTWFKGLHHLDRPMDCVLLHFRQKLDHDRNAKYTGNWTQRLTCLSLYQFTVHLKQKHLITLN